METRKIWNAWKRKMDRSFGGSSSSFSHIQSNSVVVTSFLIMSFLTNIRRVFSKNMCLTLQHGQILVEHISLLTENVRMIRKRDSLGIVIVKEVRCYTQSGVYVESSWCEFSLDYSQNIKTKKLRMKFAGSGIYPGLRIIKQFENMLKPFVRVEDLTPESLCALIYILSNVNYII